MANGEYKRPTPKYLITMAKAARDLNWHQAQGIVPTTTINHSLFAFVEDRGCVGGMVDNSECPDDDPLCECPCLNLKPDNLLGSVAGAEPTDDELFEAFKETKECNLIHEVLGESYLGCFWDSPDHPSSCGCPCVGEDFKKYVEYNQTDATYWNTPKTTPLWRNAQMTLMSSQKMRIILNGDLTLRPGKPITIVNKTPGSDKNDRMQRFTGRWLVTDIEHMITSTSHKMDVILSRDSTGTDPNESEKLGVFESLSNLLGSLFGFG